MAKKKKSVEVPSLFNEPTEEQVRVLNKLLKKNHGEKSFHTATELSGDTTTLSTGSIMLDSLLKFPLPVGIHEIGGGYGAGKTTLAVAICVEAQRKGWPTYYIDLERALNPKFFARFPELDTDKLVVLKPHTGEAATEMAHDIFRTINRAVVIYDSVPASLATEAVMAKTMSDQTMGTVAKLMSTFLAKAVGLVDDSRGRLILINQLRDNLSMYGGRPTPGGNAVEHYTTQRVFLKGHATKGKLIKEGGDAGKPVGKRVEAEVVKNRWSLPGDSTEVIISFANGVWQELELVNMAQDLGIIDKAGAWFKLPDGSSVQGETKLLQQLQNNTELFNSIKTGVYNLMGLGDEIPDA